MEEKKKYRILVLEDETVKKRIPLRWIFAGGV